MLKTFKWIYNLGVRQERVRIATHLELEISRHELRGRSMPFIKDQDAHNKHVEFEAAVSREVNRIINSILEPQQVFGPSTMFPDDNTNRSFKE